jgi:Concanavalin A-like lectin/glucanases superfamily
MEIRTILISVMTIIVVGIVLLIVYELVYKGGVISSSSPITPKKTSVKLIDALHNGIEYAKIDTVIPPSYNEEGGIEFSYAVSIVVNDYDWSQGSDMPIVLVKGSTDLSRQSPSITLRKGMNELHIVQDTYDANKPGKVTIRNLPAGKMISLVIAVKQRSMDVYVNGTLHTHLTLASLPMQNTGSLLIADNGGWNGMIGNLIYYNYALTSDEIRALTNSKPFRDPNDVPAYGPYFNTSWWVRPQV